VSAGLRTVIEVVPWLAVAVAVGLLAVGAAMLTGRHVGLMSASRVTVTPGIGGGYRRVALFGVTYALASLSCTLAVFLVVVGQALAVADPVQLGVVFAAYAAGSASLLIALSVSAALAKGALARAVRRLLPAVNRVSGTLLIGSGIYLLLYWLPSLTGGTPPPTALRREPRSESPPRSRTSSAPTWRSSPRYLAHCLGPCPSPQRSAQFPWLREVGRDGDAARRGVPAANVAPVQL